MIRERIVIIGGGIAGLATARALAQRSGRERSIVLLERESAMGRHSSGRSASIVRTATEDPVDHELARRGADHLRNEDPALFGGPLIEERGLLLTADESAVGALEDMLARLHPSVAVERLDAPRLPHDLSIPVAGAFFRREGRLFSERLLAGLSREAQRAGVWVESRAKVREVVRGVESRFEVRLADAAPIQADRVVLAAGAWAAQLGAQLGSPVELLPTRRHLAVLTDPAGVPASAPVVWHLGRDEFYYRREGDGLLISACDQTIVSPPPPVDPGIETVLVERAAQRLRAGASGSTGRLWSGSRTLTADGRFCVGEDKHVDGLFWVAGLGGSGMTAGLEVGRLAAAWLDDSNEDGELRLALAPERLAGAVGFRAP
ncbi:MAG: FAD-dependent oxidoreductase [Planctomycetota bacterium]